MNTTPSANGNPTVIAALRSALAIIWQETDRYTKGQLAQSFALLILGSVSSALVPVVYKLIIDAFDANRSTSISLTPAALVGAYIVLLLILTSSTSLRELVHGTGTQRLNRRLSNRLFGHIVRLPLNFHLDRKTGAIGETLNQGLNGCQILLQHAVFTILPVAVEFLAIIVVLVHLKHSAYLGIIAASAIAYGFTFWRAAEGIAAPSRAVSAAHVDSNATLTDSLLNYETIKYFDGEPTICARYDRALEKQESAWRGLLRLKAGYETLLGVIYSMSMGAGLGYAGYETLHGTMTVGDFVLINTYVARLFQPLQAIGVAARDMSQGLAFLQKMLDLLSEKPEGGSSRSHASLPATVGELRFERVNFSYQADRPILKDVSFSVPAGHTVAIVGTSGSGKSSLIRLLFRLYEPDSGRILLNSTPITQIPLSSLRRSIAVVPQDTVLFNDTIGSNIAFGRHGATQQEVERATKIARLQTFISGLTDGYSTEVGERGLKLSGGEKQRVSIARAALKEPAIYVFDEATSSLDSRTEQEILQNLIDVSRRSTTLIIAHRLSTVIHADTILVLEHGAIIERGSHAQLLKQNGSYAALWKTQQGERSTLIQQSTSVA